MNQYYYKESTMDKNPEGLALAFKKARGKSRKIKELGISSDMPTNLIDNLIMEQATFKAEAEEEEDFEPYIKGQRWYIESLVKFSGLTNQEKLDTEYEDAFAEVASEAEMLLELERLS